jgi:hypothetical protein
MDAMSLDRAEQGERAMRMRSLLAVALAMAMGVASPATAQGGGGEAAAWTRAQNDCQALRGYLKSYPQGRFVERARSEITRLNCPDPEADARRARQVAEEAERRAADEARARREAEDRARRLQAELDRTRTQAARPPAATPAPKPTPAAFSLEWLHPDVRAAAVAARTAEQQAERVAGDARAAAQRGQDAAARARRTEANTKSYTYTSVSNDQVRYEGDWADGQQNGNGVRMFLSGSSVGDVFAGQFRSGKYNGVGTVTYGVNANNSNKSMAFEGAYVDGKRSGFGAYKWQNGNRFAGAWSNGERNGPGVVRFPDGRRTEGEFKNDKLNGFAVVWAADGKPSGQGVYKDNTLTTPLTAP